MVNAKWTDTNSIPYQCVRAFDSISKELVMYNYYCLDILFLAHIFINDDGGRFPRLSSSDDADYE